jgi:hypothetical protein
VSEQHAEREQRVTPLELLFDVVFIFAFTQGTTVLSDDPTWSGFGHGLLILTALWWAWAAYAWLTNTVDPEEGAVWGATRVRDHLVARGTRAGARAARDGRVLSLNGSQAATAARARAVRTAVLSVSMS